MTLSAHASTKPRDRPFPVCGCIVLLRRVKRNSLQSTLCFLHHHHQLDSYSSYASQLQYDRSSRDTWRQTLQIRKGQYPFRVGTDTIRMVVQEGWGYRNRDK